MFQTNKIIKTTRNIFLCLVLLTLLSFFFPVKFSLESIESVVGEQCFIVYQISRGSTEGGCWLCIGDQEGIWENDALYVELSGKSPQSILSSNLYDTGETIFVVYGMLNDGRIECNGWDILGDITRFGYALRIPFKHYITIYDLKLFDWFFCDIIY